MSDAGDGAGTPAGFHLQGTFLLLNPCIPRTWPRFEIAFACHSARYVIEVENPHGANRGIALATLDGKLLPGAPTRVVLVDEGEVHRVRVILG